MTCIQYLDMTFIKTALRIGNTGHDYIVCAEDADGVVDYMACGKHNTETATRTLRKRNRSPHFDIVAYPINKLA